MKTKKQTETPSALSIAYIEVMKLGYSHSQLKEMDMGVNYPTLRNIRDGKNVKKGTERFYLQLFVGLINNEYERCMCNGGDGASSLLKVMRDILLAELIK